MPLDKATLKNGIKLLHDDMISRQIDSNEEYATRLADLIEAFVKSGDGVYQPGKLTAGSNLVTAVGSPAIKIT